MLPDAVVPPLHPFPAAGEVEEGNFTFAASPIHRTGRNVFSKVNAGQAYLVGGIQRSPLTFVWTATDTTVGTQRGALGWVPLPPGEARITPSKNHRPRPTLHCVMFHVKSQGHIL